MAKHLSKLDDGHYIIETDEEFKKRTGGKIGCGGAIILAIIIALAAFGSHDDKSKDSSSESKPSKIFESNVVTNNSELNSNVGKSEDVETIEEITVESSEIVEDEPQITNEVSSSIDTTSSQDIENHVTETHNNISLKDANKRVKKLYDTVKKACKKKDYQAAHEAVNEMIEIRSHLEVPSTEIDSKISSAQQLMETINIQ